MTTPVHPWHNGTAANPVTGPPPTNGAAGLAFGQPDEVIITPSPIQHISDHDFRTDAAYLNNPKLGAAVGQRELTVMTCADCGVPATREPENFPDTAYDAMTCPSRQKSADAVQALLAGAFHREVGGDEGKDALAIPLQNGAGNHQGLIASRIKIGRRPDDSVDGQRHRDSGRRHNVAGRHSNI